ncbi:MAG: hypothetical protein ABL997_13055, partial [Planctomycetota bacterium]
PMPTIVVDGTKVELQIEDNEIGGLLSRKLGTLPTGVLPEFVVGKDANDLATRFAILRRAAIASGLEVSMAEVDKSIDWLVRVSNSRTQASDTATQLALQRGFGSLSEYRTLVKEGMRIGNYVLLHSIGVDTSDAAALRQLLEGDETKKVVCRVATFDMKALEVELKAKGNVTEDDIRKWMEGKTDDEKTRLEVFDTNRVSLLLGVLRFDTFDAAQWTEELTGFTVGDEQKAMLYKQEIDRFKDDKGKPKPMDDADVASQIEKLAKVDEVLNKLLNKVRDAQQEIMKPLVEEQSRNLQDKFQAQQARDEAKKLSEAEPANEELKNKLREAENLFVQMENVAKSAELSLETARKGFDFRSKWTELTKDKAGAQLREVTGQKNAKELKDLSSIELGDWKTSERATSLRSPGDLGVMPERAQHGAFLLQATEVVVRPMKAWDDIKKNLEDMYFREQAKTAGDAKKKLLEAELLRLGKEKAPEKVAEIEAKLQSEVDKRYGEWEQKLQGDLATATEQVSKLQAGTQAHTAWDRKRAMVQAQLDAKDKQKEALQLAVKNETDAELQKLSKEHCGTVLDAAAAAAGFNVQPVGPYRRDVRNLPFFNKRFDRTVVFLWGGLVNTLEVGESTDIVEDTVERRYQVAVCDKVEALTVEDLTRREYSQKKLLFPLIEMSTAMNQSFSMDALKQRYTYSEPEGRQIVQGEKPAGDSPSGQK